MHSGLHEKNSLIKGLFRYLRKAHFKFDKIKNILVLIIVDFSEKINFIFVSFKRHFYFHCFSETYLHCGLQKTFFIYYYLRLVGLSPLQIPFWIWFIWNLFMMYSIFISGSLTGKNTKFEKFNQKELMELLLCIFDLV